MNKTLLLIILSPIFLMAYSPFESAYVLEDGERVNGIFSPKRYGLGNDLELSTHPILFPIFPNVTIKKYHTQLSNWDFASRYQASYPTLLLKVLQREGTGGVVAPDPDIKDIPQMLYLGCDLILSHEFRSGLITGKAGVRLGIGGSNMDERLSIDFPMIYPRMGVLFNTIGLNMGLNYQVRLTERLEIQTDCEFYSLPGADHSNFFEHEFYSIININKKFQLLGGYRLSWGEYPWGDQWYLIPVIDLVWHWRS